jgi:hypothetical protein
MRDKAAQAKRKTVDSELNHFLIHAAALVQELRKKKHNRDVGPSHSTYCAKNPTRCAKKIAAAVWR